MKMPNNPVKYEVLIKQYLGSILDISENTIYKFIHCSAMWVEPGAIPFREPSLSVLEEVMNCPSIIFSLTINEACGIENRD